ncbi:MAG TPA: bifunctional salicylyl-CoA 5-hydroxylase/oxidoreductase [Vicinamibacteria bacterium]|nr:bifunctional salicylyl-CoA 5-hydroxylase/oxidoreductase [Vicinamibacteria bacterium]
MRIVSVGGGPAGLYFGILMKRLDPACRITVLERNRPGETYGWGVVFSEEALGTLAEADPETHRRITESFVWWSDIDVFVNGERLRSTGHGFCGLARKRLLAILEDRCAALGVEVRHGVEADPADLEEADLVLAADGANSRLRERHAAHFQPSVDWRRCRFSWLGAELRLEAFTFVFRETEHGLFQVHAYPFDGRTSTFIVECREEVWRAAGLDRADEAETVAFASRLFEEHLGGARVLGNRSIWRSFPTVRNERWWHRNVVLLGDAAHTAHFSVGSGTKLAMEDAIALAAALREHGGGALERALGAYEESRKAEVGRLQAAAQTSLEWFEDAARRLRLDPLTFSFSLLTRSKRITYDNLRERDPALVGEVTARFAERAGRAAGSPAASEPPEAPSAGPVAPPIFQPLRLRGLTLANRIVVSPMCQYSCDDGTVGDWHLVHLGSRAIGGAGLVFAEATHVSREGRISPGCAGMYRPEHVGAWRRVVDFVHAHSAARIGLQIAHAGRKGACSRPWEGDRPLAEGGWPLLAPSAIPYDEGWPVPREMDRADMDRVREEFVRAAGMAHEAGFDVLELHMAHGYLLAGFLSPLTNRRRDEHGGPIENRMRFPLEVFDAVRAAWPEPKPVSVRISATDWREGGLTSADRIAIGRALKAHGCDVLAVSGGQTVPDQRPVYGRMFQVPFSEEIRLGAGIPTMTVGNVQNADQANTILAAGRADLVVLARAHLVDPYLTLRAAVAYGYDGIHWPPQYLPARPGRRKG